MSDDLISRKALKQAIYIDFCEHFTQCHDSDQKALIDMVMDDIDEIPAAFDKEKVLSEMRSEYTNATNMYIRDKGTSYAFSSKVRKDTWEKALEIVEKGGVE